MDNYQEKQLIADVASLKKTVAAQAATLTLLLGILKTTSRVHPANIVEGIDSLNLHPIGAGDLKQEAKKLIQVYFP